METNRSRRVFPRTSHGREWAVDTLHTSRTPLFLLFSELQYLILAATWMVCFWHRERRNQLYQLSYRSLEGREQTKKPSVSMIGAFSSAEAKSCITKLDAHRSLTPAPDLLPPEQKKKNETSTIKQFSRGGPSPGIALGGYSPARVWARAASGGPLVHCLGKRTVVRLTEPAFGGCQPPAPNAPNGQRCLFDEWMP